MIIACKMIIAYILIFVKPYFEKNFAKWNGTVENNRVLWYVRYILE